VDEREARRELRWAKLIRHHFLPYLGRGYRAAEVLQEAGRSGDLVVLRVLAEGPDPLFGLICDDLITGRGAAARAIREYLHRPGGPYPDRTYRWRKPVARDLAELFLHPAPDELTAGMRRIVVVAAALRAHPFAQIAQRKILAARDQGLYDDLCELARHSPTLAAFCQLNELRPSDPGRRPMFWLLTRQFRWYRAADPDGSLTIAAYAEADAYLRKALRSAVVAGGFFEVLRRMTGDEYGAVVQDNFDDLSAGMVRDAEWDKLWELISRLTLDKAVRLAGQLPADWQPQTGAERLAVLRSIPADVASAAAKDPGLIAELPVMDDLRLEGYGRARVVFLGRDTDDRLVVDVHELPSGEQLSHHTYETEDDPMHAVVCADGTVVADAEDGLWRYTAGERSLIHPEYVEDLQPTADGWVGRTDTHLLIGSANGQLERMVDLGIDPVSSAVSADGTRIAIAGDHTFAVLDSEGNIIGSSDHAEEIGVIGFLDDSVLTAHQEWQESRKYRVVEGNDFLQNWDDVDVHVSWHLTYWDSTFVPRAKRLPVKSYDESYEDPDTAFDPYGESHTLLRTMSRDHSNPGRRPAPPATLRRPELIEIPGEPPRWETPHNGQVVPGTSLEAVLRDTFRVYDARPEHDALRRELLALFTRRLSTLSQAELEAAADAFHCRESEVS
jgi:hypothetical protein